MEMGALQTILFIQPGNQYDLYIPPRREKTEAEEKNPFFQPVRVHLRVKKQIEKEKKDTIFPPADINSKIFRFDTLIFSRNRELLEARRDNKTFDADSLIQTIEDRFIRDTSDYFRNYRYFRYGLVQINSSDKKLKFLYDNYLQQTLPQTGNPAYMELFNKMYDRFFFYYARTPQGKGLVSVINRKHDLKELRSLLKNHPAIPDDTLADLVILKEVNEQFYKNIFYKKALLILLDSLGKNPALPHYEKLAAGIHDKLTSLMIGTPPPELTLTDRYGKTRSLDNFKGRYIYLNFCTTDNYTCMMEYPFLESMHSKHAGYLEVLTVMVSESHQKMVEFMERNNYHWNALYYDQDHELLEKYDIRAYPTAYLIGPDGRLIQSPATLASEGFEEQLFRIMRARGDL